MVHEGNLKSGSVGSVGSAELLPAVRDLYSRLPETYRLEPWELQHMLYSLGYVDDLADEAIFASSARWREETTHSVEVSSMSERELDRLRRAMERLMNGQREALGVIDQEVEDQKSSAQETLAEVQDILSGAYEDAQTILEEGGA